MSSRFTLTVHFLHDPIHFSKQVFHHNFCFENVGNKWCEECLWYFYILGRKAFYSLMINGLAVVSRNCKWEESESTVPNGGSSEENRVEVIRKMFSISFHDYNQFLNSSLTQHHPSPPNPTWIMELFFVICTLECKMEMKLEFVFDIKWSNGALEIAQFPQNSVLVVCMIELREQDKHLIKFTMKNMTRELFMRHMNFEGGSFYPTKWSVYTQHMRMIQELSEVTWHKTCHNIGSNRNGRVERNERYKSYFGSFSLPLIWTG